MKELKQEVNYELTYTHTSNSCETGVRPRFSDSESSETASRVPTQIFKGFREGGRFFRGISKVFGI